jgi:hypothetical protein
MPATHTHHKLLTRWRLGSLLFGSLPLEESQQEADKKTTFALLMKVVSFSAAACVQQTTHHSLIKFNVLQVLKL